MGRDLEGSDGTDVELLAAWRAGDPRSGKLLWTRHHGSVQAQVRNKVPWAEARDVLQETFIIALNSRSEVRNVRAYLLGISLNLVRDHFRKATRRQRLDERLDGVSVAGLYPDPEQWVGAKRERRLLLHAMRRVQLKLQMVLELRYWEGLRDHEIAEVLGRPLGTVKTQLAAGREALAQEVRSLGRTPAEVHSTLDTLEEWAARTQASIAELRAVALGHAVEDRRA